MNIFRYELLGNENLIMYEYAVKITLEYFKSSLTTDDKLVRKFNSPNDKLKKPNKNVININIISSTSSGPNCINYMNTQVMNFTCAKKSLASICAAMIDRPCHEPFNFLINTFDRNRTISSKLFRC